MTDLSVQVLATIAAVCRDENDGAVDFEASAKRPQRVFRSRRLAPGEVPLLVFGAILQILTPV
jgi:hypothetical protein